MQMHTLIEFANTRTGKAGAEAWAKTLADRLSRILNRYAVVTKAVGGLQAGDVVWFEPSWGTKQTKSTWNYKTQIFTNPVYPVEVVPEKNGIAIKCPPVTLWLNKGIDTESPEEWVLYMWDRAGYTDAPAGAEDFGQEGEVEFGQFMPADLARMLDVMKPVKYSPRKGFEPMFDSPESATTQDYYGEDVLKMVGNVVDNMETSAKKSHEKIFSGKPFSPEEEKTLYPFGDITGERWGGYSPTRWEDYLDSLSPEEREKAMERYEAAGEKFMQSMAASYNDPRNRPGDKQWTGD